MQWDPDWEAVTEHLSPFSTTVQWAPWTWNIVLYGSWVLGLPLAPDSSSLLAEAFPLGMQWMPYCLVQFSSVAQSYPTVCDPMNRNMPGLSVHHRHPESNQTHAHWLGDAIQPSHLLSSPSPPASNPSQHQGLFQWVNSLHQVTKLLEFQLQHQSFQWTPRTDLLQDGLVGSPCSPRDSQESSPAPQFKSINSLALSFL